MLDHACAVNKKPTVIQKIPSQQQGKAQSHRKATRQTPRNHSKLPLSSVPKREVVLVAPPPCSGLFAVSSYGVETEHQWYFDMFRESAPNCPYNCWSGTKRVQQILLVNVNSIGMTQSNTKQCHLSTTRGCVTATNSTSRQQQK